MLLQHIFRAYARRPSESMVSSNRPLDLFHVDRRPGIGRPPSLRRSFRTLFRSFGVRRAIRRPRVSCILPRPRRNSSFYPPDPATTPAIIPVVLPAMRIRIRQPDAWRIAISLCRSARSSFSPPPHSGDSVRGSGSQYRPLSATKRRRAGVGRLLSTYSEIASNSLGNLGIYQNLAERRGTG